MRTASVDKSKSNRQAGTTASRRPYPKPEKYILEFSEHCCRKVFDVNWVIAQLAHSPPRPPWFLELLSLMLLGWVFSPEWNTVRKSLAWHIINREVDAFSKTAKHKMRYTSAISGAFILNDHSFARLYKPLGGMNSLFRLSRRELAYHLAEQAKLFTPCLLTLNYMMTVPKNEIPITRAKEPRFDFARKKIAAWAKAKSPKTSTDNTPKQEAYQSLVDPRYRLPVGGLKKSNIAAIWKECRPGAEFALALLALQQGKDWQLIEKPQDKSLRRQRFAYKYITEEKYHLLPFNDRNFQLLWLQTASYFSSFLQERMHLQDLDTRFSQIEGRKHKLTYFKGFPRDASI
jgi:hypothetical protein